MKHVSLGSACVVLGLLVACSSSSTTSNSSSSGSSGTTSSSGSSGTTSSSGSSGNTEPAASTTAADVQLGGTCPAFTPCGGSLSGTYDYTGGCVADALSSLKTACPTADTSKLTLKVTGSIYFLANAALHRNVTAVLGGSLTIPQACSFGQCATAQSQLTASGLTATCTGTTDCTCTVSKTDKQTSATTFTVNGNTVTTGDGDTYDICLSGADLTYKGTAAGSEDGTWTLKQR
jgi:hypothetical protein